MTAWESQDRVTIEAGGKKVLDVEATGATERYFDIKNLKIDNGRAFTAQEVRSGAPVIVLGEEIALKLFPSRDPVGQQVRIVGQPYRVIGVVAHQGKLLGFSLDRFVIAPARSPIQDLVNPPGVVDALIVKAATIQDMRDAMNQAEGIMRSRRHLRPRQDNTFVLETSEGVLDFWAGIQKILVIIGPGLVGVSLVVGGIVIMNIMLMAVAERTREIGLRKSLGARRTDILRQFLAESATIATVGAAIGVFTGVALSVLLNAVSPLPATVSPLSILLGVVIGMGVGIVAGVYPASRAARLDPITALRQE
jgi:putative ABC transport system permease protein